MAKQTPTNTKAPDTTLYKLVADRLGRDPLEFIRERRAHTPPMAFARIADEMKAICNKDRSSADEVYLTHEVPRRWLAKANQRRPAKAA